MRRARVGRGSDNSEGREDPRGSDGSGRCGPRGRLGGGPEASFSGVGTSLAASPASGAGTREPQLAPGLRGGGAGGGGGRWRSEPARPGPSGAALLLRLGAGKNVPSHGAALGGVEVSSGLGPGVPALPPPPPTASVS